MKEQSTREGSESIKGQAESKLFQSFTLRTVLGGDLALPSANENIPMSLSVGLNASFSFIWPAFSLYFQERFSRSEQKGFVNSMSRFTFQGGVGYSLFMGTFTFMPYVTGGIYTGGIQGRYTQYYLLPAVESGLVADYFLSDHVCLTLNVLGGYMFSQDIQFAQTSILLGAGYKL